MNSERRFSRFSILLPILAIYAALLVLTLLAESVPESSAIWTVTRYFNLSFELNVGVWIVVMLMLLNGLLAVELFGSAPRRTRYAWLIMALVFIALSWDELGSFHERIGDGGWGAYLPVGLVLGISVAYAIITLLREAATRRSAILIAVGFGLFALVVFQEYLESQGVGAGSWKAVRAALEEGSELLANLLFLAALMLQIQRPASHPALSLITPSIQSIKRLFIPLLIGAALHFLLVTPAAALTDIGQRGDPAAWYPAAAFFLIAVWSTSSAIQHQRPAYVLLALIALGSSLASVFLLSEPLNARLPWLSPIAVGIMMIVFAGFYWRLYGFDLRRDAILLIAMFALVGFNALSGTQTARYETMGVLALLIAGTLIRRTPPDLQPMTETAQQGSVSRPVTVTALGK